MFRERLIGLFGATSGNVTITARKPPVLTIAANMTTVYVGDPVVFTGSFKQAQGQPIAGATVTLYRDSISIGSGVTDAQGNYSITWIIDVEGTIIVHSEAQNP